MLTIFPVGLIPFNLVLFINIFSWIGLIVTGSFFYLEFFRRSIEMKTYQLILVLIVYIASTIGIMI